MPLLHAAPGPFGSLYQVNRLARFLCLIGPAIWESDGSRVKRSDSNSARSHLGRPFGLEELYRSPPGFLVGGL